MNEAILCSAVAIGLAFALAGCVARHESVYRAVGICPVKGKEQEEKAETKRGTGGQRTACGLESPALLRR